jgi:hypothetical protein
MPPETSWALRDVGFAVEPGEMFGRESRTLASSVDA